MGMAIGSSGVLLKIRCMGLGSIFGPMGICIAVSGKMIRSAARGSCLE